jgi:hypothetical protein
VPLQAVFLLKFTIVSLFEEWYVIGGWCRTFISIRKWSRKSFPREDSFSLGYTVISVGGISQLGEWYRFNNQGQAFPRVDSFSLGCTIISVGGMAKLGEWSMLKN